MSYALCVCLVIIRKHVLEHVLVGVLLCYCCWCLVEQFIEFTFVSTTSYTFCTAVNPLQLVSEVGYCCTLTKTHTVHRE